VEAQVRIADLENVPFLEFLPIDFLVVDEGAPVAAVVDDGHVVAVAENLAVVAGDLRVVELVVSRVTATEHEVGPGVQRERLALVRALDDEEMELHGTYLQAVAHRQGGHGSSAVEIRNPYP